MEKAVHGDQENREHTHAVMHGFDGARPEIFLEGLLR